MPRTRRLTRLDRDEASRAAAASDIRPALRIFSLVAGIGLLVWAVSALTPSPKAFGGPLQGAVAGSTAFTAIRKTGGGPATLGIPVPWNAGPGTVVVETLAPIGADGVKVKRAGVVAPASVEVPDGRGFPPEGVALLPLDGFTVPPGGGALDGFQVVVGLMGEGTVDGFALAYRVGGTTHVAILPDGAMLCSAGCAGGLEVAEDAQRSTMADLTLFVRFPDR